MPSGAKSLLEKHKNRAILSCVAVFNMTKTDVDRALTHYPQCLRIFQQGWRQCAIMVRGGCQDEAWKEIRMRVPNKTQTQRVVAIKNVSAMRAIVRTS